MSGSLNKAILIGTLGRDPEIRTIPNGSKVASFSIATNKRYTDKRGNKNDSTTWHNIVMWRGLADIAEKYLRKGMTAYFEGEINNRRYEDKNGVIKYTTEIVVDNMQMLGGKKSDSGPAYDTSSNQDYGSMPPDPEDDLPF